MKKVILLSLIAVMTMVSRVFAQSSLIATLSHEGTISTFYGASALSQAHDAAANGDVITLSSGAFVSVNITKAITLRGAGWESNADNHSEPTVISGSFSINIPAETTERLTMEGIYHNATISYSGTLQNATFLKSRFKTIEEYYNTNSTLKNATFIHCRVAESINLTAGSSASLVNCVVWSPTTKNTSTSNFECVNCVLYKGNVWDKFYSSSLRNCILIATNEYTIPSSCVVYNCVGLYDTTSNNLFSNVPNKTNTRLKRSGNNLFATYSGSYNDSEKFELTDGAETTYLGNDGTQVGIYGGTLPFSSIPTNPQITRCNVAAKSTADGKLSVDIEVSSAE